MPTYERLGWTNGIWKRCVGWSAAAGLMFVAACSTNTDSKKEDSVEGLERWPASEAATKAFSITEWAMAGQGDQAHLFGGQQGDGPNQMRVFVHVWIKRASDGSLVVDSTMPEKWHLEHLPGKMPVSDGPMPSSVAFILSSGVLDRLDHPSTGQTGASVAAHPASVHPATDPVTLTGSSKPLVACTDPVWLTMPSNRVVRLIRADVFTYADLQKQFPDVCNVQDPNWSEDKEFACIKRAESKGCDPQLATQKLYTAEAHNELETFQQKALLDDTGMQMGICHTKYGDIACHLKRQCQGSEESFSEYTRLDDHNNAVPDKCAQNLNVAQFVYDTAGTLPQPANP